jgi:hypothetical protein
MHKQNGFVSWIVIVVVFLAVFALSIFAFFRVKAQNNNKLLPLTSLTTPYYKISDLSGIGPYSSNKELAGYTHNGLDFMSANDLTEYRAITGGKVQTVELFYERSRNDTHPQINVIVQYDKHTMVAYTFEPYTLDMDVANRQLTLMNVKAGDTIQAGQSLGKLIKTAPQSHVHVHISRDQKEFCLTPLFTEAERAEMTAIVEVAPNVPAQLCYE